MTLGSEILMVTKPARMYSKISGPAYTRREFMAQDDKSKQHLKRILVATDFSEESDKAVDFAAELVSRDNESTL